MSEIFERNKSAFLERYPQYQQKFSELELSSLGNRFRVQEKESHIEFYHGSQLWDSQANELQRPGAKVVRVAFLEGFGLGFNLQSLIQLNMPDLTDIIVIEPDFDSFCFSLMQTDFKSLFSKENLHFLVGLEPAAVFSKLFEIFRSRPEIQRMQASHFFEHSQLSEIHRPYFHSVKAEWSRAKIQLLRNLGNLEDSLIGLRNTTQNLEWLKKTPGIQALKDEFRTIPSVVVSAGPSLVKSLGLLKEIQDRVLIISGDATAKVLLDNDIEPHFVCTIERLSFSKKYFDDIAQERLRSYLVAYPIVPSDVIESFQGPHLSCFRDYSFHIYLNKALNKGVMPSSSSVAHMCLRLADFLGSPRIYLIGQDLAYDPDTLQSHTAGIAYGDWAKPSSKEAINQSLSELGEGELIEIPGNLRDKVPSNPLYYSFIKEFGFEVLRTRAEVINATEGGAQIPGMRWIQFSDLKASFENLDRQKNLFEKAQLRLENGASADFQWTAVIAYLSELRPRMAELERNCSELSDAEIEVSQAQEFFSVINRSKSDLETNLTFVAFVLEMSARSHIDLENQRALISNSMQGAGEVSRQFKLLAQWFQVMGQTTERVLEIVKAH